MKWFGKVVSEFGNDNDELSKLLRGYRRLLAIEDMVLEREGVGVLK